MKREFVKEKLVFRLDVEDTNFFSCNLDADAIQKSYILEKANISISMVATDVTQMIHIDTNERPIALNLSTRVSI